MGSRVIVIQDPLALGVGTITRIQPNGEIAVTFDRPDRPDDRALELLYVALELELEDVWLASAGTPGDDVLWFQGEAA